MAEELGVAPGEPSAAASPGTHCPVTVSQVFSGTSAKSGGSPTGCTFDANASADPIPLAQAVPVGDAVGDAEWTTVTVEGEFEQGSTTLLRNRPVARERAWHLLEAARGE